MRQIASTKDMQQSEKLHNFSMGLSFVHTYLLDDSEPKENKDPVCLQVAEIIFDMNHNASTDVSLLPLLEKASQSLKDIATNGEPVLSENGLALIHQAQTFTPENSRGHRPAFLIRA